MSRVWLLLPYVGAIRLSTVLAFVVILVVVTRIRRSPLLALLTGMGWVMAYELVFQTVALALGREPLGQLIYLVVGVTGWVVAAHLAGVRPHPVLLGVWALTFAGWIAYGFHYNDYGKSTFSAADEVFNVITKDGLALVYLAGALAPFRLHGAPRSERSSVDVATTARV